MRRGTLAFKLYVLGLVQMLLLGGAVVLVGFLIEPPHPDAPPAAFDGPRGPSPVAEEGRAPPSPPPHLAAARPHHRPGPVRPLLTFFFSGLVILAVGSFWTARWILRPLEELSRAARSFGAGDLRARTQLTRADEIGDVGRAFDDMAGRIQKLLVAERELLANVSHELRTPLARIRVALDIAGEGDAEAGRLSLTEIGVDLTELERLVDDILTTARLEAAGSGAATSSLALRPEVLPPAAIGARAAERFRAAHPARPLEVEIASDLPSVRVDPVLFRRAIDNLLENAHKYTPDPARPITLRAAAASGGVLFEVRDRGMGIRPEDLAHVFTPFFRGERSRSRGTGGVGLGLTLVKRIVEVHDGAVALSSDAEGTRAQITLPRAKEE